MTTNRQPNNSNKGNSYSFEAESLLIQSMNLLSDRIAKAETDFVGHLKKVEDRLDQIVELTKSVAVLQTQTSQQTDHITEIRGAQREQFHKADASLTRVHSRIEEVQSNANIKLEAFGTEVKAMVKDVENHADSTDRELKAWLNRGWGAWAVFTLAITISSGLFYKWVDSIEQEKAVLTTSVTHLVEVSTKTNNSIQKLTEQVQSNKQSIERLDIMMDDLEKQLEYMRIKR